MAQRAVAAPFRECDLGDEVGPDPMRTLRFIAARRVGERGLVDLALDELGRELAQHRVVEARSDLARITQLAVFMVTEKERTEALARAPRLGVAADHHFLALDALDLL